MFPSLEIPEESVKMPTMPDDISVPTMPDDISVETVYVVDGVSFKDKTEAVRYQQRRQRETAEAIVKQLPESHDNKTIYYEIWEQVDGKKNCPERHANAQKAYERLGKVTVYWANKRWIDQVTITENADGTVDLDRQLVYRNK